MNTKHVPKILKNCLKSVLLNIKTNYFLLKTEPKEFSINDLENEQMSPNQTTVWGGIRNPTARNNLKSAQLNDICFIYHSSCGKLTGIYGLGIVCKESYSDPTVYTQNSDYYIEKEVLEHFDKTTNQINDVDAKWTAIDIQFVDNWNQYPILLTTLKEIINNKDTKSHVGTGPNLNPNLDLIEDSTKDAAGPVLKDRLSTMDLFRMSRLSVQKVTYDEAECLFQLIEHNQHNQQFNDVNANKHKHNPKPNPKPNPDPKPKSKPASTSTKSENNKNNKNSKKRKLELELEGEGFPVPISFPNSNSSTGSNSNGNGSYSNRNNKSTKRGKV